MCSAWREQPWVEVLVGIEGMLEYCVFDRSSIDPMLLEECLSYGSLVIKKAIVRGLDSYRRLREACRAIAMFDLTVVNLNDLLWLLVKRQFEFFDEIIRDMTQDSHPFQLITPPDSALLDREALCHLVEHHLGPVIQSYGLVWLIHGLLREYPAAVQDILERTIHDLPSGLSHIMIENRSDTHNDSIIAIFKRIREISQMVGPHIIFHLGDGKVTKIVYWIDTLELEVGIRVDINQVDEAIKEFVQRKIYEELFMTREWTRDMERLLDFFIIEWRDRPELIHTAMWDNIAFQIHYTELFVSYMGVCKMKSSKLFKKWHDLTLRLCSDIGNHSSSPWYFLDRSTRGRILAKAGLDSVYLEKRAISGPEMKVAIPFFEGINPEVCSGSTVWMNLIELTSCEHEIDIPEEIRRNSVLLSRYHSGDPDASWRDLLAYARAADYLGHERLLCALEEDLASKLRGKSLETILFMCTSD
jgi:hypothetical protein